MDLEGLRGEIDSIDKELLSLLLKRMDISRQVAEYKLKQGLPIFQPEREQAVLDSRCQLAPPEMAPYVREFFQNVMETSKHLQQALFQVEK